MKACNVIILITVIIIFLFNYFFFHIINSKTRMFTFLTDLKSGLHNRNYERKHWLSGTPIDDWLKRATNSKLNVEMKNSKSSPQKVISNDTFQEMAIRNGANLELDIRKGVLPETLRRNGIKRELIVKNDTKPEISDRVETKTDVVIRNILNILKNRVVKKIDTKHKVTVANNRKPEAAIKNNTKTDMLIKNKTESNIQETKHNISNKFTDPGKWTILLTVNNGFYDMFENWWWHFRKLNIKVNVTVIAEDDIVYNKLKTNYSKQLVFIVRSWILNITSALEYNSNGYHKMVSTRPAYIIKYIEESRNILYVDIDTVFLKNPFQYFIGDFDMWAQVENQATVICSGFIATRYNNKTISVMKQWYSKLNKKLQRNQPALNEVLYNSDLKINRLSENKFVGGPAFAGMSAKQRSKVVLLHATYCFGHQQKQECFKEWKLWAMD